MDTNISECHSLASEKCHLKEVWFLGEAKGDHKQDMPPSGVENTPATLQRALYRQGTPMRTGHLVAWKGKLWFLNKGMKPANAPTAMLEGQIS